MSAEQKAIPREIASIVIPYAGGALLLPNVSVAEIVPHADIKPVSNKPSWYLGEVSWRGVELPVASIITMNGSEEQIESDTRVAVINGIKGDEALSFYSLVVTGLPRLVRVTPNVLQNERAGVGGVAEYCRVMIAGQELVVPNLDYIEERILETKRYSMSIVSD